ncbi:hypothetical protein [Micromonospora zamorensis]|uniref:hypothetical protein n=1 Tax=Micromonospora zamorensis TaxID=709883 RepID=UPI003CF40772
MTALTVRKQTGAFVLDSGAGPRASLRTTGWTWRCGEIRTDAGLWTVEPTDRRRIGVTARAEHGAAVRLDPSRSHVPGPGGVTRWAPGRCGGELVRGGHRLAVRLPGHSGCQQGYCDEGERTGRVSADRQPGYVRSVGVAPMAQSSGSNRHQSPDTAKFGVNNVRQSCGSPVAKHGR